MANTWGPAGGLPQASGARPPRGLYLPQAGAGPLGQRIAETIARTHALLAAPAHPEPVGEPGAGCVRLIHPA